MEAIKNDNCSVLVVEDDIDLCAMLGMIITDKCLLHFEHTLTHAAEYLSRTEPDIVLLDNSLPDGVGVLFIGRALACCPGAKIVLMTADAGEDLCDQALQAGAVKFIRKPFSSSVIREVIFSFFPEFEG